MKKIINSDGNVFLIDKSGLKKLVMSIKPGITFNVQKTKASQVTKVSVYSNNLTDEFFFYDDRPVFHHLQTRNASPNLMLLYCFYFIGRKHYDPFSFAEYILKQYFKEQGFEVEVPDEENKES